MAGQARLLVVDDEPSLQDVVATSMRFLGYDVSVAASGREAVRKATEEPPDLVILDVMLPDFDGLEVMRRMRAAGIDAGVVFLSARDTPADKIAGLTAGGDDYVTKPFGLEELAARVSAVLRRVRPETRRRRGAAGRRSRTQSGDLPGHQGRACRSTWPPPSTRCCAT